MSSCGNCDCSDKSQCVKKGNSYGIEIVEVGNRYGGDVLYSMTGGENEPKCNCGPNCSCTNCTCGH